MSTKTSFAKVIFVFAVLGALALAAVAPSVARAFFAQGVTGFARRISGGQVEAVEVEHLEAKPLRGNTVDRPATGRQLSVPSTLENFEFIGKLTAKDGTSWTVEGVTVHIALTTELKGGLEIGILVKVEGTLQADGSVLARQIKPVLVNNGDDDDPDRRNRLGEFEFEGILKAKNGNIWTVEELNVMITAETEIKGNLEIGIRVKVHAVRQEDGSIVVIEIEKALVIDGDDDDDDSERINLVGEFEFEGILQAKNGNIWTVRELKIIITAETEIKGNLEIGIMVKVHAVRQDDGTIVVIEIERVDDDDHDDDDQSGRRVDDSDDDDDERSGSGGGDDDDDDRSGPGSGDDDDDEDDDDDKDDADDDDDGDDDDDDDDMDDD